MKTKTVKTKDGERIKLEIIEDFDNYRGFYFLHKDKTYTKASYNSASFEDIPEEENISLFTAIYLSLLSWICIFFIILVVLVSTIQHIFEKSKFNEKYKALNERFMHKKRDKKDG